MSDNPYSFLRSKKGSRQRASIKPRGEEETVLADREVDKTSPGVLPDAPMGSSGLSVEIKLSTPFARQAVSVTVWGTRPNYDDPADRERVRQELAVELTKELRGQLDSIIDEFFPDIDWAQED